MGIPVSKLRDVALQRKMLLFCGIALIASIVVPVTLDPLTFAWNGGGMGLFIWPIVAGGSYLLVTIAPPDIRAKVPPIVLQWLPFAVSYAGIGQLGEAMGIGVSGLYVWGYPLLCFGLLSRIAQPQDQVARIIIGIGGVTMILSLLSMLSFAFHFEGGIFMILHNLLWFVVVAAGSFCVVFIIPPQKLPPAIQAVDSFGPLIAAVLLAWLPVGTILFGFALMFGGFGLISGLLFTAHMLLPIVAYFGVLMMTAPAAYEEAKAIYARRKGGGA